MLPGTFITENGQVINEDIVRQVSKVMQEADEKCASFCDNTENNDNIAQLSVGEVFRRKFMEYLEECQSDSAEVRELKTALFYWHLRLVSILLFCLWYTDFFFQPFTELLKQQLL